jgi:hypothetical protein
MKKIALAAMATVLAAGAAHAAPAPSGNTSTTQGAATATVVAPIVLTHDDGAVLSFGTFTVGTGGSVTVDSSGSGTFGGDVGEVTGSSTSADAFSVEGDPGRGFDIVTSDGAVSNGADKMAFTTAPSADAGQLDGKGRASFTVGGELSVAGTESAGEYTGSYDATVTYN